MGCHIRWPRLASALGFAGLLTACAGGGKCTLGAAADLPVTTRGHAFFTDITINGGTAHLQVDTGAFANLLSEAAVQRLGMTQQILANATLSGVGLGGRPINLAMSDSVQVGAAHAAHVAFATTAPDAFLPGTDGLLGMDFMAAYDDDLDFGAGHLRLVAAHGDCSAPASPLPDPVYIVPLERLGNSASPVVTVSISGVKLKAVIDTGAMSTLLFRPAAERIGLPVEAILAAGQRNVGGLALRPTRGAYGRLRIPVDIGALQISNLPMAIADQRASSGADMLLGYDFVSLVHVWISHSSHTVMMQYPARATPVAGK
jgi:predicted aspartyl protease